MSTSGEDSIGHGASYWRRQYEQVKTELGATNGRLSETRDELAATQQLVSTLQARLSRCENQVPLITSASPIISIYTCPPAE